MHNLFQPIGNLLHSPVFPKPKQPTGGSVSGGGGGGGGPSPICSEDDGLIHCTSPD